MPDDRLDEDERVQVCSICGRSLPRTQLVRNDIVRPALAELIQRDHPQWSTQGFICHADLNRYRAEYVRRVVDSEEGELVKLEKEAATRLRRHEVSTKNVDDGFEQTWTFSQRLADRVAAFVGTWTFLIFFMVFVLIWMAMNSIVILWHPADPYPFIFLNLVLSCISALQAPIILMSQNRQEAKDRLRSQHDYRVNLRAEMEIRQLHEKIDHMLSRQWERLPEIQEIQLESLNELARAQSTR